MSKERVEAIYERLLKDRIVFIGDQINDASASLAIEQMLFLQCEDSTTPLSLYIMSPGGAVTAGLAIYDTMQFLKVPVETYVIGSAASLAALLAAAGRPGFRYALPKARLSIAKAWGGENADAKELESVNKRITEILVKHTQRTHAQIEKDMEEERSFSASEAIQYGLVDRIVSEND